MVLCLSCVFCNPKWLGLQYLCWREAISHFSNQKKHHLSNSYFFLGRHKRCFSFSFFPAIWESWNYPFDILLFEHNKILKILGFGLSSTKMSRSFATFCRFLNARSPVPVGIPVGASRRGHPTASSHRKGVEQRKQVAVPAHPRQSCSGVAPVVGDVHILGYLDRVHGGVPPIGLVKTRDWLGKSPMIFLGVARWLFLKPQDVVCHVQCCGMEWNGMERNGMERNGME